MSLASRFSGADISQQPDLATLTTDRQQALWVLAVGKESLGLPWMTPAEIEAVLRDGFGIHVPRQRIPGLLADSGGAAVRRRIGGRFSYQILVAGIKALAEVPETVTFVDPSQALTHIRRIETVLAERTGVVHLCDPYVDGRTLDFIAECAAASEVRLLTATINKPHPLAATSRRFVSSTGQCPLKSGRPRRVCCMTAISSTAPPC